MKKLVAIACVVSWSGFWAFGYLALSVGVQNSGQLVTAAVLAALGLFSGVFTYVKLARDNDGGHWQRVTPAEGA
jgi:hypothetical protein